MLEITLNGNKSLIVDESNGQFVVDGTEQDWDIEAIDEKRFHIIYQNRSHSAELLQMDPKEKRMIIRLNGTDYSISARDKYDILLSKLGMENAGTKKAKDIKAPMPGLILEIKVDQGAEITEGDAVLVLEAMKMENILKSPTEAKVKKVLVEEGQAVEKNQILVELE